MLNPSDRNINYSGLARTIIVVVFLYFCPALAFSLILRLSGLYKLNAGIFYISRILYWIGLVSIWQYAYKIERQPLLLWEERSYPFTGYIKFIPALFVILFVGMAFIQVLLHATHLNGASRKLVEMVTVLRQDKFLLVFAAATAGITEELVFRGYLQPRLEIIFGRPLPAIFLSAVLFGLLHMGYGTIVNVIGPFFIGLVFAAFYRKYRNIKVLMITHFLWDMLSLALLIRSRH